VEDENNLSDQYIIALKKIWYYENPMMSMDLNNIEELQQMNSDDLHVHIFSTELKIMHLEVSILYIYFF